MDESILNGINAVVLMHVDQEQAKLQKDALKKLLKQCYSEEVTVYYLIPPDGPADKLRSCVEYRNQITYREGKFGGLVEMVQMVDCKLRLVRAGAKNILLGGQNLSGIHDLLVGSLDGELPDASLFRMARRDYMEALGKSMYVRRVDELSFE